MPFSASQTRALTATARIERTQYIAPDGMVYDIDTLGDKFLMNDTGWGMPPIEYITQRGPFQHGETLKDFFLKPRIIQAVLRVNSKNRGDYWDARAALLNSMRPNRQPVIGALSVGKLRKYLANGDIRDLDCLLQQGPAFEPRKSDVWDEWSFQEVLRFTAFNPVAYDPTQHSISFVTSGQLVFPITFPITFGASTSQATITYAGTWLEYPTITLNGPLTNPSITNITTGETIAFDYDLAAGDSIVITLTYGQKSVLLDGGTNLIGYLTNDSALDSFHLEPDPGAPGGRNVIQVAGVTGASSDIELTYYNRYIGL